MKTEVVVVVVGGGSGYGGETRIRMRLPGTRRCRATNNKRDTTGKSRGCEALNDASSIVR